MSWLPLPYLLATLVLAAHLLLVCVWRPPLRLWPVLPVAVGLALLWTTAALVAHLAPVTPAEEAARTVAHAASLLLPVAGWLLALRFSETYGIPHDELERPWLPCLYMYAGAMLVVILANPWHGHFADLHPEGGRESLRWAGWTHAAIAYGLSSGAAVFYAGIRRRHRSWAVRRKVTIMAAAYVLPPLVSFMHLVTPSPSRFDPIVFSLAVSISLVMIGVYRRGLFNPLPVAVREILHGDPHAVLITDGTGHLVFANEAARGLLGPVDPGGEVDVFPYLAPRLIPPTGQLVPPSPPALRRLLTEGEQPADGRLFRSGRAAESWLRVRVNAIRAADDVILAHSIRVERLTGSEEMRALCALTEELARSNRDLEEFAYTASHELRVPLWMMRSLARSIEEDAGPCLPEKSRDYLRRLQARAGRMEKLVERLLAYAQVGRAGDEVAEVDCGRLVQAIVQEISPPPGIRIEVPEPLPVFHTSRVALERVLSNLVANAVRHHDRPLGTISITARDVGSHWEFSVSDDGPGIDPADHERIFGMRQTLEHRESARTAGIGLALVRKQVRSVGGEVGVDSRRGEGARFRFTWPKKPEASSSAAA